MRKILFLTAALFTAATLFAQDFDSTIKRWNDGPLTWDDFTVYSGGYPTVSYLDYNWHAHKVTTKTGNLKVTRMQTECYMSPVSSWVNPNHKDPYTLLYQQTAFNYVELCRRQLQKELDFNDKGNSASELNQFYYSKADRFILRLHEETDQGQDTSMVRFYDVQVREELDEFPKESDIPVFQKKDWGLGLLCGYGNEFRLGSAADFVLPKHGIYAGFSVSYKNVYLTLTGLSAFGGKNPKEITHNGDVWPAGAKQKGGVFGIDLSVPVIDGTWVKLAPFVGTGVGYIETVIGKDEKGKDKTYWMNGLRFSAGMSLDIKYKRWLDLSGHDLYYAMSVRTDKGYSESSIRFLAYVAHTNFAQPIGPSWSINFGLAFNGHEWDVR